MQTSGHAVPIFVAPTALAGAAQADRAGAEMRSGSRGLDIIETTAFDNPIR
jgi:hypothetical protein